MALASPENIEQIKDHMEMLKLSFELAHNCKITIEYMPPKNPTKGYRWTLKKKIEYVNSKGKVVHDSYRPIMNFMINSGGGSGFFTLGNGGRRVLDREVDTLEDFIELAAKAFERAEKLL